MTTPVVKFKGDYNLEDQVMHENLMHSNLHHSNFRTDLVSDEQAIHIGYRGLTTVSHNKISYKHF